MRQNIQSYLREKDNDNYLITAFDSENLVRSDGLHPTQQARGQLCPLTEMSTRSSYL
jgi:hypothetical protein